MDSLTQPRRAAPETARQQVTALYQAHALGLVRLAVLSADGSALIGSLYSQTYGSHLAITRESFTGLITKGTRASINLAPALVPLVLNGEVAF